jgi:dolichol-phosphate mannosyltransferase
MMNADLEDPPEEIPKLLTKIETEDFDIVHGLRKKRQSPLNVRFTSLLFNTLLNKLTGYEVPINVATLRVMNRRFIDAYNSLAESSRYIPGLEMWLGFKRGYVDIEHRERRMGRSSYSFRRRLMMAFDSIISFSDLPLKIVAVIGFIVAILGFVLTVFITILKLLYVDIEAGYASTISFIVFLSGVQVLVVGVASLYIGRILREVQNRPLYVVRETINVSADDRVDTDREAITQETGVR